MIQTETGTEELKKHKLPARDFFLMPLIGVITILLLCLGTETLARCIYPRYGSRRDCQPFEDPYLGIARPSLCRYISKGPDSGPVEVRLNRRGFRDDSDFPAKAPGTYRIVLIGSSYAFGALAPREDSLAGLLPAELSRMTGRKIELYNESIPGFPGLPQSMDKRFPDVLAAQPDLILWVFTRWDVKAIKDTEPEPDGGDAPANDAKGAAADEPIPAPATSLRERLLDEARALKTAFSQSESYVLLQHVVFVSPQQFAERGPVGPDEIVGYLRANLSPAWQDRLRVFNNYAADIVNKAHAAGVPVAATMIPTAENAAMISSGPVPAGFDPLKLDHEIGNIIDRDGGVYLDVMPEYRNIVNPQRGYSIFERHPNPQGEKTMTDLIAQKLMDGTIPELRPSASLTTSQRAGE